MTKNEYDNPRSFRRLAMVMTIVSLLGLVGPVAGMAASALNLFVWFMFSVMAWKATRTYSQE